MLLSKLSNIEFFTKENLVMARIKPRTAGFISANITLVQCRPLPFPHPPEVLRVKPLNGSRQFLAGNPEEDQSSNYSQIFFSHTLLNFDLKEEVVVGSMSSINENVYSTFDD